MKLPPFLQRLKKPKIFIRRITGDSMLPLFKPAHIAVALPQEKSAYREGDVVVVNHGGLEKVKRIKEIKDGRVFVVGDNQTRSTDSRSFGWLHFSAVKGKVVWPRQLTVREMVQWTIRSFGVLGTLLLLVLFFFNPTWPTPDKLLVFLTFVFMIFGQAWAMLKRLLPFGVLLLIYESFRGVVPYLNDKVNFTWMIDMDKLMFGGTLPTVALQEWLWNGALKWYDFIFYMTYMLHFILPLFLVILVWKLRPAHYWRVVSVYVVLSFAGFLTYLLFPAAPPWMAAQQGYMPEIHRVSSDVYAAMGLHDTISVYNGIGPNQVAAVPSLHAGYATVFSVMVWMLFGWRWGALTLVYPFIIFAGTVYAGEHYVIDELLGAFYAAVTILGVYLFVLGRRKQVET